MASSDVYEALRLLSDIDNADYRHAYHDKQHPQHNDAVKAYQELAEYCFNELNRRGSCNYQVGKSAPPPPALKETRPGFRPP